MVSPSNVESNQPSGKTIAISQRLNVRFHDDACTYFLGTIPLFTYAADDRPTRNLIIAQMVTLGHASPSAIAKVHGISPRTVYRYVQRFRQYGSKAFFNRAPPTGRPLAIRDPEILERAANMLLDGASLRRTARELGINYQTLRNYKAAGRRPGL